MWKDIYNQIYILVHSCTITSAYTWTYTQMHTWLLHFHTLLSLGHVPHTYLIYCLLSFLGSCAHGGLQKVSRPIVVQLNWRGFSYKAGAWGRDSAPNSSSSLYWVAPLRTDGRWAQDDFSSSTMFIPNVPYTILPGFFVVSLQILLFHTYPRVNVV